MQQIKLKVEGMTCGGCVKSIQKALNAKDGVADAVANLDEATVSVDFDPAKIAEPAIRSAIVDAGFSVA